MDSIISLIRPQNCHIHNLPIVNYNQQNNQALCEKCFQQQPGIVAFEQIQQQSFKTLKNGLQMLDGQIFFLKNFQDSLFSHKTNLISSFDKITKIVFEQITTIEQQKKKFKKDYKQSKNQLQLIKNLEDEIENIKKINTLFRNIFVQQTKCFVEKFSNFDHLQQLIDENLNILHQQQNEGFIGQQNVIQEEVFKDQQLIEKQQNIQMIDNVQQESKSNPIDQDKNTLKVKVKQEQQFKQIEDSQMKEDQYIEKEMDLKKMIIQEDKIDIQQIAYQSKYQMMDQNLEQESRIQSINQKPSFQNIKVDQQKYEDKQEDKMIGDQNLKLENSQSVINSTMRIQESKIEQQQFEEQQEKQTKEDQNKQQKIRKNHKSKVKKEVKTDQQQTLKEFEYQLIDDSKVKQNSQCFSFAFNNENNILFVGSEEEIIIYQFENRRILKELKRLKAHKDSVVCLYFMKHSNKLVSGSHDNSIIIWRDQKNNYWKPEQILVDHQEEVNCLIMNQSEDLLISGSHDKYLKFWMKQADNWSCKQTIKLKESVIAVSLNETDNKLIACGGSTIVYIIEMRSNKNWSLLQEIKTSCQGFRLCFTYENQFVFQPCFKNYLEIFDQDIFLKQFQKISQVYIGQQNDCCIYFPCQFIKSLNILAVKNGTHLNIYKTHQDGKYELIQTIYFCYIDFFGKLTNDGEFLVTWEHQLNEIQLRRLIKLVE